MLISVSDQITVMQCIQKIKPVHQQNTANESDKESCSRQSASAE